MRAARIARIQATMRRYLTDGLLTDHAGAVLVERRIGAHTRRGLMLELDLEHYDYSASSTSLIRPTEGTIVERLAPRIEVRRDDFHITRYRERRETTTIFAVDASGSSALHRLAEAKGAVNLLLAECYVRRDQVGVIAFRGRTAEVLLPPTRSLVRAKRSLAELPGGGGTPLASGLQVALGMAAQVRRTGAVPVVVLLTDGRANVALDGGPGRARAEADALFGHRQVQAAVADDVETFRPQVVGGVRAFDGGSDAGGGGAADAL
jgi:Mg-chelatase subunit ChlD